MYGAALLTRTTEGWASQVVANVLPGATIVAFGDDFVGVEGRMAGLEVRDTFVVLWPGPVALFAFFFRKPLTQPTVGEQLLSTATGGVHVDACRVATSENLNGGAYSVSGRSRKLAGDGRAGASLGMYESGRKAHGDYQQPSGRWPPNLLLVHGPGCVRLGTKKVVAANAPGRSSAGEGERAIGFGKNAGNARKMPFYTDPSDYGMETVAAWECERSCPVLRLDTQTGELSSGMMVAGQTRQKTKGGGGYHGNFPDKATDTDTYGDSGGASRFFPQFQGPEDVLDWFRTLICPPGLTVYEDA